MQPVALLFTYRSLPGLAAAAQALGLPDALLDVPHYGYVRAGAFALRTRDEPDLPGVRKPDIDLAFALDRWLVVRYLLETPWARVLRPDARDDFTHGFIQQATVEDLRAELAAGGYLVLEWATARLAIQPRRPAADDAALLAAARAVAAAPDPSAAPVPGLPPKLDLGGPDSDEAIRELTRAGQLWRTPWFWNTPFDGDPDDVFRVHALARDAGVGDHDWARFLALAPQGRDHGSIELWLVAHLQGLPAWLKAACAAAPQDLAWISEQLRHRFEKGPAWIEPLAGLRARATATLASYARGAGPPPPTGDTVDLDPHDPSYSVRLALLLLATPGHAPRARAHLARLSPSSRGGGLAGLIAVVRLFIDDPGYPPHLPDLGRGLELLGWSLPDGDLRSLQRHLRARAADLDEALAAAARAHWPEIQAGAFGRPRFELDDSGEILDPPRDVPALLAELLDDDADLACERRFVGELIVTSGRISATDPLTALWRDAFTRKVPRGRHRVEIAVDDDGRVGALIVRFNTTRPDPITRWEPAARPGEDPDDLPGFPVDGGIAGLLDARAAAVLDAVPDLHEALVAPALSDSLAAAIAVPGCPANAIVARSGDGDGHYTAWWGLGARDVPRALVVDFRLLEPSDADRRRDAITLARHEPFLARARAVLDEHFGPRGFTLLPASLDRDLEEVAVRVRRDDLELELAGKFDTDDRMSSSVDASLRAFHAGEEIPLDLADHGIPALGVGPYLSLALLDARLARGVDVYLADLAEIALAT